uniref:hypothetical protein n=1 Tax=Methanosaeta sp. UBA356 TaxID=1915559 RepID=UPI00257BBC54
MFRLGIHKFSVLAYGDRGSPRQSIPSQKQRLHLMRKPSRHLALFCHYFSLWHRAGSQGIPTRFMMIRGISDL